MNNNWIEFRKVGGKYPHHILWTYTVDWREAKGLGWRDWNVFRRLAR